MELKNILFIAACLIILCLTLFTFYLVVFNPKLIAKSTKEAETDKPHLGNKVTLLALFYALEDLRSKKKTGVIFWMGLIGTIGTVILIAVIIGFYTKMKLTGEL